jgi:hypothetical protein
MGYDPTTEVTAEQVFAWAQEEWDKQQAIPSLGFKIRRGYCGMMRIVPGAACDIEAVQDAVYSHGYRVVFWAFDDGRSREVCAVEKADAAERAHWGKQKEPTEPQKYVCSRMQGLERRRGS